MRKKEEPDEQELLLSDAFLLPQRREEACLECRVLMLNINLGHNRQLMIKCRRLEEYAQFIKEIRDYLAAGQPLREAVDRAVDSCIRQGILEDILRSDRAEVVNLILTEYNEKQHLKNVKREGYEEGRQQGEAQFASLVEKLVKDARTEDLLKAASNPEMRKKLYEEYGIKESE